MRVERRLVASLGAASAAPALDHVMLADGESVAIDAAFVITRLSIASPLARQLGCEFDEGPVGLFVRTDQFKQTTVPGVYAAGDMARMPSAATWAAADGVTAGVYAHQSMVFPQAA